MFGTESKRRLSSMQQQVQQMLAQVGTEAHEFQASLTLLKRDIDALLSQAFKLYDSRRVDRLAAKLAVLQATSRRMGEILRSAAAAKERAFSLRDDAGENLDPSIASPVASKCLAWVGALDGLLTNAARVQDLDAPLSELARIEAEIAQYEEAVRQLISASGLVEELGPARSAAFQAAFGDLRNELIATGPGPAWLAQMEKHLSVLRALADEPKPEPPALPETLHGSRRMLPTLRQWSHLLGAPVLADADDRLQKIEDLVRAGKPAEVEELHRDLQEAIRKLEADAAERRQQKLTTLQEDAHYYEACCGDDPTLGKHLQDLAAIPADSPANYEDWKHRQEQASTYFISLARLRLNQLSDHLKNRIRKLEECVAEIRSKELSVEVASETSRVAGLLVGLRGVSELEAVLEGLRQVTSEGASSLHCKIAELQVRARREWTQYEEMARRFYADGEQLRTASKATGISIDEGFLEAAVATKGAGLEVFWKRLSAAQEGLARQTRSFVQACQAGILADLDFARTAHAALTLVSTALPPVPDSMASVDDVVQAAEQRRQAATLRADFERRVEAGEAVLQTALEQARQQVEALLATPGTLELEDRDGATGWLDDLVVGLRSPADSTLVRATALAGFLGRYQTLFGRFEKDEKDARRLWNELQIRVQRFSDEEFRRFFPEAAQRVSALAYGVNLQSRQWAQAKEQIAEAARILELLEAQARRLTALEVTQGRKALEKLLKKTIDAGKRKELQELKDLLNSTSPGQFVPLPLRRRLAELPQAETRRSHA
jgi:hypothetical protein